MNSRVHAKDTMGSMAPYGSIQLINWLYIFFIVIHGYTLEDVTAGTYSHHPWKVQGKWSSEPNVHFWTWNPAVNLQGCFWLKILRFQILGPEISRIPFSVLTNLRTCNGSISYMKTLESPTTTKMWLLPFGWWQTLGLKKRCFVNLTNEEKWWQVGLPGFNYCNSPFISRKRGWVCCDHLGSSEKCCKLPSRFETPSSNELQFLWRFS